MVLIKRGDECKILMNLVVSVVQLVRALDCGSRGWGFESPRSPQKRIDCI